jgi:hypothetical protein
MPQSGHGRPHHPRPRTAVNALGNGWSAQVVGDANDYTKWPSIDLYVSNSAGEGQGALTARG